MAEKYKSEADSLVSKLIADLNAKITAKQDQLDVLNSQVEDMKTSVAEAAINAENAVKSYNEVEQWAFSSVKALRDEVSIWESRLVDSKAVYAKLEQEYRDREANLRGSFSSLESGLAVRLTEEKDRLSKLVGMINDLKKAVASL
jgi:chromosome segregation ATPase